MTSICRYQDLISLVRTYKPYENVKSKIIVKAAIIASLQKTSVVVKYVSAMVALVVTKVVKAILLVYLSVV